MGDNVDSREQSRERDNRSHRRDRPSRFSDANSRDRSREKSSGKKGSGEKRVYVSNIPYEYRWQDLKDLFRKCVADVAYVETFVDENDKPRGCGVVEFCDPESVAKCLEVMHRYELNGRKLVIKEDFGNERDKQGRIINGRKDRSGRLPDLRDDIGGMQADYNSLPSLLNFNPDSDLINQTDIARNTYGLSTNFLKNLGITGQLLNRVFVANLDYKVDEKKLTEVFKLAGRVINVDLSRGKDGESRGFAVIEYDHPVESVQAISMLHNQQLFDRRITVRMDRNHDGPLRLPEGLGGVGLGLGTNGEPLRDVSHNLPSNNNPPQIPATNNTGNAGLLGALPAQSLQTLGGGFNAANLTNAVTNSALAGLTAAQLAALQTSLANVGNLSNPLLTGDLSALAGLGAAGLNSLTHSNLAANLAAANQNSLGGAANTLTSQFQRNDNLSNTAGSFLNSGNSQLSLSNMSNLNSLGNLNSLSSVKIEQQDRMSGNRDFLNRDFDVSGSKFPVKQESDYRSNTIGYTTSSQQQRMEFPSLSRMSDTIVVSNLPQSVTWQSLQDRFRVIGEIKYVEMRGKESALIRFQNENNAKDAVDMMDRARIDGRTIDVRLF